MTDKKQTLEQVLENTRKMFENTVYNDQPDYKVILPVIRNTMPNIIAEEIPGVQPMTSQPMTVGENYNKARAEFWVTPAYNIGIPWEDTVERNRAIREWCENTYGPKGDWHDPDCRWHASNHRYIFHNEEDRTMFILRWS